MTCSCDERFKTVDNGLRVRLPESEYERFHDCSYCRRRAALVPKAVQRVLDAQGDNLPGARFTRLFSQEMERLAREAKLI